MNVYLKLIFFLGIFTFSCAHSRPPKTSTNLVMQAPLSATVSFKNQSGLLAELNMVNLNDRAVSILQLNKHEPTEGWEFSNDAYQVALLQSFHILKMTLIDKNNVEMQQNGIMTMADPEFETVELSTGQGIQITIPIDEFYTLEKGMKYTLLLEYGRDEVDASVETHFTAK